MKPKTAGAIRALIINDSHFPDSAKSAKFIIEVTFSHANAETETPSTLEELGAMGCVSRPR